MTGVLSAGALNTYCASLRNIVCFYELIINEMCPAFDVHANSIEMAYISSPKNIRRTLCDLIITSLLTIGMRKLVLSKQDWPCVCLQFVIVIFSDHTHLLFLVSTT